MGHPCKSGDTPSRLFRFRFMFISNFLTTSRQQHRAQVVISFSFPHFNKTLSPCGAPSNACSLFLLPCPPLCSRPPSPLSLSPSGQYILLPNMYPVTDGTHHDVYSLSCRFYYSIKHPTPPAAHTCTYKRKSQKSW